MTFVAGRQNASRRISSSLGMFRSRVCFVKLAFSFGSRSRLKTPNLEDGVWSRRYVYMGQKAGICVRTFKNSLTKKTRVRPNMATLYAEKICRLYASHQS